MNVTHYENKKTLKSESWRQFRGNKLELMALFSSALAGHISFNTLNFWILFVQVPFPRPAVAHSVPSVRMTEHRWLPAFPFIRLPLSGCSQWGRLGRSSAWEGLAWPPSSWSLQHFGPSVPEAERCFLCCCKACFCKMQKLEYSR